MTLPRLRPVLAAVDRYAPTRHAAPCDLDLAGTELPPLDSRRLATDLARANTIGYPDSAALRAVLGRQLDVPAERILVTAGSDEALERAARVTLGPGRTAIVTDPTFEMLPRWIRMTGASIREVPWPTGPFPTNAVIAAIDASTSLIAMVTPNNPTGSVAAAADIAAIARSVPEVLVLVDLAYVEFADSDPSRELLSLANVVITRTFSKAWGLAALRLGYAAGPAGVIEAMQRVAPPHPAAAPSIAAAERALARDREAMENRVAQVRQCRDALTRQLTGLGMEPTASQANFVATAVPRAAWLRDGLAGLGIATRSLVGPHGLRVRITSPAVWAKADRLAAGVDAVLAPQALLFDLDGVIADVSRSYRATIVATASRFGAPVSAADVRARKAAGQANDDWQVTHDLVQQHGIDATLGQVIAAFESAYQGGQDAPGFRRHETLIPGAALLRAFAQRIPLAIVTGRPRQDAERFLAEHDIADIFRTVVCREDAPLKPDPAPIRLALRHLDVTRAWMIGDTPDDIRAARAAGVVPIGILAPGEPPESRTALDAAGSARVLTSLEELLTCLP